MAMRILADDRALRIVMILGRKLIPWGNYASTLF